jgi:hypothetical protein
MHTERRSRTCTYASSVEEKVRITAHAHARSGVQLLLIRLTCSCSNVAPQANSSSVFCQWRATNGGDESRSGSGPTV